MKNALTREWRLPPIPGFPDNWRNRHQSRGAGVVEFKRIAPGRKTCLTDLRGGNNAREWWVVDKLRAEALRAADQQLTPSTYVKLDG